MSKLVIFNESGKEQEVFDDYEDISRRMETLDVRFERWTANRILPPDASQDEVISAYRDSVERLTTEYGFKSVDVVSLRPDHPQRDELRKKFLDEHVHSDFEVRFFVEGRGLFYLHVEGQVYAVLCEQGDLISVPAQTPHWFDMGENPDFKCIRLFVIPDGWVAETSGSDISKHFPTFDRFVEAYA